MSRRADRRALIRLARGSLRLTLVLPCATAAAGCRSASSPVPSLALIAHEYRYEAPDSVPSGIVRIQLRNMGRDVHEALLVRFTASGGSAAKYVDSVRANVDFPAFATDVGGARLTLPSDSSTAWLELVPGHYAIVCWKGNHLRLGMAHDLIVTPAVGSASTPPAATAELTLLDHAYRLAAPLGPGRQILHVRNAGSEAHEADIFRLPPETTVDSYLAWLEAGEVGAPPATPVGGLGDLAPGREIWIAVDLTPGRYVILCQVPSAADGAPHYKHGMRYEFSVP